jgi:hypothetical protein
MRPRRTALKADILEWLIYQPYVLRTNWQFLRYRRHRKQIHRSHEVVVSLTSFPARFGKLHNCLKALIGQQVKPDQLVLYLSREECTGQSLPEAITSLQKFGLTIRYTDTNHRSLNKVVHALKDFPSSIVVTCDDDKLYPSDWLQRLLAGHQALSGSCRVPAVAEDCRGPEWTVTAIQDVARWKTGSTLPYHLTAWRGWRSLSAALFHRRRLEYRFVRAALPDC